MVVFAIVAIVGGIMGLAFGVANISGSDQENGSNQPRVEQVESAPARRAVPMEDPAQMRPNFGTAATQPYEPVAYANPQINPHHDRYHPADHVCHGVTEWECELWNSLTMSPTQSGKVHWWGSRIDIERQRDLMRARPQVSVSQLMLRRQEVMGVPAIQRDY